MIHWLDHQLDGPSVSPLFDSLVALSFGLSFGLSASWCGGQPTNSFGSQNGGNGVYLVRHKRSQLSKPTNQSISHWSAGEPTQDACVQNVYSFMHSCIHASSVAGAANWQILRSPCYRRSSRNYWQYIVDGCTCANNYSPIGCSLH